MIINFIYLLLSSFVFFWFYINIKKNLIEELKNGGKLIFIRHAYAPGGGDPDNFDINDCNTQRNLSDRGKKQAYKL